MKICPSVWNFPRNQWKAALALILPSAHAWMCLESHSAFIDQKIEIEHLSICKVVDVIGSWYFQQ